MVLGWVDDETGKIKKRKNILEKCVRNPNAKHLN